MMISISSKVSRSCHCYLQSETRLNILRNAYGYNFKLWSSHIQKKNASIREQHLTKMKNYKRNFCRKKRFLCKHLPTWDFVLLDVLNMV